MFIRRGLPGQIYILLAFPFGLIGAVIIKKKLTLSDEETVLQIQECPYLHQFIGVTRYQEEPTLAPCLFVEIRRRMESDVLPHSNKRSWRR